MTITFELSHQLIHRTDHHSLASGSRNYVYAKFDLLTDDWTAPITAVFGDYSVILDSENQCLVPWEVLASPGTFSVSAFCADLHTAICTPVTVHPSGYIESQTPQPPTPSVYAELADMVQQAVDTANSVQQRADAGEFNGPPGEPGPQGPKGQDGTVAFSDLTDQQKQSLQGKSAYAYAQDGGFTGTEGEFAAKLAEECPTFAALRTAAPVNLLDNSDFRNPVNQRDVSSWNTIGYGIDRWFTNGTSANISVTRNGLQGSADFLVQKFEKTKLNGASKVTAVVQVNGAIYFGVLNISNFTPGSDIVVITGIPGISRVNLYHEDNDICQFYFAGLNSVTIEWAALYAGEYTTQTLPEYRTKGYSVELLECLRYYRKYKQGRLCTGLCYNTTTALFAIQQGVPMRIVPTVVSAVGNVLTSAGTKQATYAGSFYSTVSVATFDMSTSEHISGEACIFEGILELSADL